MSNTRLCFVIVSVLVASCVGCTASRDLYAQASDDRPGRAVKLRIDMVREERMQREVLAGHQPWRMEAVSVAYVAVMLLDKSVREEKCSLIHREPTEAKVECRDSSSYVVSLSKLFGEDGIWTAIEIETK